MRRLLGLALACGMAWLAGAAQAAAPTALEIPAAAERVAAWPALSVVAPADPQLTPERAAQLAAGADAIRVDSPHRIFGRGTLPYWALLSLRNPEAAEQLRLLAVETTTQFDMRLFARDAAGAWQPLPLLIVTDLTLTDANGAEAMRRLREAAPHSPLLVFTALDEAHLRSEAKALGVRGYLIKNASTQTLRDEIRAALGAQPKREPVAADAAAPSRLFTPKQLAVLEELAAGRSNQ